MQQLGLLDVHEAQDMLENLAVLYIPENASVDLLLYEMIELVPTVVIRAARD
jgi:hypothetical protein